MRQQQECLASSCQLMSKASCEAEKVHLFWQPSEIHKWSIIIAIVCLLITMEETVPPVNKRFSFTLSLVMVKKQHQTIAIQGDFFYVGFAILIL